MSQDKPLSGSTELTVLPTPEGLYWTMKQIGEEKYYFAAISNWDDYEEEDNFDAYVYNEDGE